MESFLQFFESRQDEQFIIRAIIKDPNEALNYFALADMLDENGQEQVASILRKIGQNATDAERRFEIAWENLENEQLRSYLEDKKLLWRCLYW